MRAHPTLTGQQLRPSCSTSMSRSDTGLPCSSACISRDALMARSVVKDKRRSLSLRWPRRLTERALRTCAACRTCPSFFRRPRHIVFLSLSHLHTFSRIISPPIVIVLLHSSQHNDLTILQDNSESIRPGDQSSEIQIFDSRMALPAPPARPSRPRAALRLSSTLQPLFTLPSVSFTFSLHDVPLCRPLVRRCRLA